MKIMPSLKSQIKSLLPIDTNAKVDELIVLLKQRNTMIDNQMYYRICCYIGNTQLKEFFFNSIGDDSLKIKKDCKEQSTISAPSLIDVFKPLDSITKINRLVDAIKDAGGVITPEGKANVYLKIWDSSLKSYWSTKCIDEIKVTYLPPKQEKSTIKKEEKANKSHSFANQVEKKKRVLGILDPNSSDYNNQVLKEALKSRYTDYEYGLSDW